MFVPDQVWVTANFKEIQLDHMRPGEPVTLEIDAYPERTLRGHVDSVQPGSVLGRNVGRRSGDGTIRLWDVTTGAESARLEGHSYGLSALCVLPDGRLASGSADHTIRLWDVTTGAETARLEADAPLLCLTALADLHLVAGDTLGRLHWLEVVVVVRSESTHALSCVRWARRHPVPVTFRIIRRRIFGIICRKVRHGDRTPLPRWN